MEGSSMSQAASMRLSSATSTLCTSINSSASLCPGASSFCMPIITVAHQHTGGALLDILRLWACQTRNKGNPNLCHCINLKPADLSATIEGPGRACAPGERCRGKAGSGCGTTLLQQFQDAPARGAPPTLPQTGAPAGSPRETAMAGVLSSHTRVLAVIRQGRGVGSALTSQPPAGVLERHAHISRQNDTCRRTSGASLAAMTCSEYVTGQAAREPS